MLSEGGPTLNAGFDRSFVSGRVVLRLGLPQGYQSAQYNKAGESDGTSLLTRIRRSEESGFIKLIPDSQVAIRNWG